MEEVYSLTVEGADVVKKELDAIQKKQVEGARASTSALQGTLPAIKSVAKDLNNLGLEAGKSFTMATQGALSVVEAIGTGGMAGAIGLATLAVGGLVQGFVSLRDAHKNAEAAAKQQFDEYEAAVNRIASIIDERSKALSSESVLKAETEVLARRAVNEGKYWDLIAAQDDAAALRRANRWIGTYGSAIAEADRKVAAIRESIEKENVAIAEKNRQAQVNREQLDFEKQAKKDAEEQEKRRKEAVAAAKKRAEDEAAEYERTRFELFISYSGRIQGEMKSFWDKVKAINAAGAEQEIKDEKRKWDMLESVTLEGVKADIAAEKKMISDVQELRAEGMLMEQARALDRMGVSDAERIAVVRNIAAIEQAREDAAFDARMAELDRVEAVTEADQMMVDAQRATAAQLYEERKAQREADTEHHIQQMKLQARATDLATAANFAYGEASMFVAPMVATLSNQVHRLGELNRENAFQIRDFAQELPALIAKEAQAYAAGIAAQALGKASISALDAGRETALGVGMMFSPGGQAAAAGHFKSAALHAAMAAGYGALAGGGAGAAVGIGAMRGEGGLVPLTREEQERNAMEDARRARRSGDGRGDGSGISGRAGGSMADAASEAFVVNISYSAGAIAPADERRAAQAVARASRRARNSSFDRRTMGG